MLNEDRENIRLFFVPLYLFDGFKFWLISSESRRDNEVRISSKSRVLHPPRIHVFSSGNLALANLEASEARTGHFCPSTAANTTRRDHNSSTGSHVCKSRQIHLCN
ncbi:hypothetical protein SCLCIDRAFT_928069 [Scleroderma citrinum Foug A]|uniref:Uncharacterized protein n=1 Tax=Scleroderma citrinum Foug A TaxID=1036808 RepID=A0A0C3DX68_9AGAM|nr:hypothetical protein SCLCIDRAFT_928069 [Scleroderma citrinum Foug A]